MSSIGDISIVYDSKAESLRELPPFLNDKSEKAKEIYRVLRALLETQNISYLMADFYTMTEVPMAIIDLDANVLASSKWQRICLEFHRANPESEQRCIESDIKLANALEEGEDYTFYHCKNGLVDCASPVIIDGEHVANLFVGQFLFDKPYEWRFTTQAKEFGYDKDEYIKALHEVPIITQEKALAMVNFMRRFAQIIATMALDSYKKSH